jgi:hypothetical protein
MKKIKIILTDKNHTHFEFLNNYRQRNNTVYIHFFAKKTEDPFIYQCCSKDTKLMVFDAIRVTDMKALLNFLMSDKIIVNRMREYPFAIPRPETVIFLEEQSYNLPAGLSYQYRFEVIKCEDILETIDESIDSDNNDYRERNYDHED